MELPLRREEFSGASGGSSASLYRHDCVGRLGLFFDVAWQFRPREVLLLVGVEADGSGDAQALGVLALALVIDCFVDVFREVQRSGCALEFFDVHASELPEVVDGALVDEVRLVGW